MLIYTAEKDLRDVILNDRTVAYSAPVLKMDEPMPKMVSCAAKINRETPKTNDLYYTRSVYVSTNWNLNSDIFLPEEVWRARYTPVDKQTNIGHDHSKVVGHIVSTWAISANGDVIDGDTPFNEVPDFFHLCNGGVIYTKWQDEEMQKEVDALIHRIENAEEYVSMECLFSEFDYGLKKENSEDVEILKRDEDTAFLTAKLQAYGGNGEYDGYQLGRVLRNINYSGKGYVQNPGNPYSVIFSKDKISKFSFAKQQIPEKTGVYTKDKETNHMSDTNKEVEIIKVQLDKAMAELNSAREEAKALRAEAAEKQVKANELALAELTEEVKVLTEKLSEEKEAKACMCHQHEELKAKHEKLKEEFEQINQARQSEARLAALKAKGLSNEEAQVKANELKNFSDDNFNILISMLPSVANTVTEEAPKKEEPFTSEAESDESAEEIDESVAPVEATKANLTAEVDKIKDKDTQLKTAFASRIAELLNEKETK